LIVKVGFLSPFVILCLLRQVSVLVDQSESPALREKFIALALSVVCLDHVRVQKDANSESLWALPNHKASSTEENASIMKSSVLVVCPPVVLRPVALIRYRILPKRFNMIKV